MLPTAFSNQANNDSRPADAMISVVRYCGVESSSIVAGIKSGLAALKRLAWEIGLEPRRAVVIFKNVQPTTVTVEVGIPVPEDIAYRNTGEFKFGRTPGNLTVLSPAGAPGPITITITDVLRRAAEDEGLPHEPCWWQVLDNTGDLDWTKDPIVVTHAGFGTAGELNQR